MDFILASSEWRGRFTHCFVDYAIDTNTKADDHFPVVAELSCQLGGSRSSTSTLILDKEKLLNEELKMRFQQMLDASPLPERSIDINEHGENRSVVVPCFQGVFRSRSTQQ